MAGFLDLSPITGNKYQNSNWNMFFAKIIWSCVLSYGITLKDLKSCWLTQESFEQNPFSTFCLIWPNSISRQLRKKSEILNWEISGWFINCFLIKWVMSNYDINLEAWFSPNHPGDKCMSILMQIVQVYRR